MNQQIAHLLREIALLLEIKGIAYKPNAYRRAALALEQTKEDISRIYKKQGRQGLEKIPGLGKSIAWKIEEYLKKGKIKYLQELKEETAIRQVVTHYFESKGISLAELKKNARKRKIVYSRFTRPAKELLELAGSVEKAKEAIDKVVAWADSRGLDYTIETVFKKWLELDRLKPKEIVKKPYYDNNPMVWSEAKRKWYVIDRDNTWLEFAGREKDIEWRSNKNEKKR